jgi:hypothetical protein
VNAKRATRGVTAAAAGGRAFAVVAIVAAVFVALPARPAVARDSSAGAESSTSATAAGVTTAGAAPARWRGSILLFDQSMTTQTAGLGADYQTYNPTYEWWVAFKPRYTLLDRPADTVAVNLWMNVYLELTNSDTTARYREPLLGPTYLWGSYGHTFRDRSGAKTSASIGPRFTFPTDRGARATGQIMAVGAIGGLQQTFPLLGKAARALTGGRLGLNFIYGHPLNRWTSPQSDDVQELREDVNGVTVVSHQLRGQMNVRHSLSVSLLGDVQLSKRLSLSLSYVVINSWRYPPPAAALTTPPTGPVVPISNTDPTTYGVNTWIMGTIGYNVVDELTVSIGYYNLTNQLGPDGTRRNPLWSPAARLFLTLTANLDAVYERIARPRAPAAIARDSSPAERR